MRDEHTYDSCCRRVKESLHEGMAVGSGGLGGKDTRACKTLAERVISRRALIGICSKRMERSTLSQGQTPTLETHLAVVLHQTSKERSAPLGHGEAALLRVPVKEEGRQPDLLPPWKVATSPSSPQSAAQLRSHILRCVVETKLMCLHTLFSFFSRR